MFGKFGIADLEKSGTASQSRHKSIFKPTTFRPSKHTLSKDEQPKLKSQLKKEKIQSKQRQDLSGSQFRVLNEVLYTSDSHQAKQYFQQNPQHYSKYHEGFRKQCQSWDINPVDRIIQILKSLGKTEQLKVIDLGCGDAKIQHSLEPKFKKIRSYDLVKTNQKVEVVDISKLPLKSGTQDVAVFCLSLMGTNYLEFIVQSLRILKVGGLLIIAQVQSRSPDWQGFQEMVRHLGTTLKNKQIRKYFRIMEFTKTKQNKIDITKPFKKTQSSLQEYSKQVLKPCIYKKR